MNPNLESPFVSTLPSGLTIVLNVQSVQLRCIQTRYNDCPIKAFHPSLSCLIDVDHFDPSELYGELFTGYSIADVLDGRCHWTAHDQVAFADWIKTVEVKLVEAASLLLIDATWASRFVQRIPSTTFVSPLERRVELLNLSRANAYQWRGTLQNLTNRGIRRDELEWSRLLDRLSDDAQDITKHRIVELIRANRTRLILGYETALAFDPTFSFDVADGSVAMWFRGRRKRRVGVGQVKVKNRSLGYKIAYCEYTDLFNPQHNWFALNERNEVIVGPPGTIAYKDLGAAEEAARTDVLGRFRGFGRDHANPRWRRYVLPGGRNYREWLLVMPDFVYYFQSDHFTTPNVLLHIRTTLRSLHGHRVLFIEELQSDWHETGRQHGYGFGGPGPEVPPAPFSKEWPELGLKCALYIAASKNLDGVALVPGQVQLERYPAREGLAKFYDELLPRHLDKLVRPFGAALEYKAGNVPSGSFYLMRMNLRWYVARGSDDICSPGFTKESDAWHWLNGLLKARELTFPFVRLSPRLMETLRSRGISRYGAIAI